MRQELSEKNRDLIASYYKAMFAFRKSLAKKTQKDYYTKEAAQSAVRALRENINYLFGIDKLQARQNCGFVKKSSAFFYGNASDKYPDYVIFTNDFFFKEEVKKFIRGEIDRLDLHPKESYFEKDGKYYRKTDFFCHNGEIYNKKEFKLSSDGTRIINLKKEMEFEIFDSRKDIKGVITLDDGTEFTTEETVSPILGIRISENNRYLPSWLITSMFSFNGKRRGKGYPPIFLNEKDFDNIEFKPTKQQLELLDNISESLSKNDVCSDKDSCKRYLLDTIKFNIYEEYGFGSCRKTSKRILNKCLQGKLFSNLSIYELKESLKTIKMFLVPEEEAKNYVDKKISETTI